MFCITRDRKIAYLAATLELGESAMHKQDISDQLFYGGRGGRSNSGDLYVCTMFSCSRCVHHLGV